MSSVQEVLNHANPNDQHNMWNKISVGDIIAGMIPRQTARTGLTLGATQVHNIPGQILAVTDGADAPLAMITAGAPGAGQVRVTYNASTGIPTLVFNAALTAYKVTQTVFPTGLGTILTSESGASH